MKILLLIGFSVSSFLGQVPMPEEAWKLAIQSGFNAMLVLLLLWIGRAELRAIANDSKENASKIGNALDRHTHAINRIVLAMAFLPKQFHAEAERSEDEIREATHERHHPTK